MSTDEAPPEASAPAVVPTPAVESISVGPYILYPESCLVHFVDDSRRVVLTKFEMTLLTHLATQAGTTVSKEELTRLMYNGQRRPESNGLEVFVGRIRRKIDPADHYKPLQTVRYSGYRFRADWQQAVA